MATLNVNGAAVAVDASGDTPLLWVLRDHLRLTGTKYGCGVGSCGACTVLLDGVETRSCMVTLDEVSGRRIVTIEGLAAGGDPVAARVTAAWIAEQVSQCGFCAPGLITATVALLRRNPNPTDADIDGAISNLCRCGTYERVRKAIHRAAASPAP